MKDCGVAQRLHCGNMDIENASSEDMLQLKASSSYLTGQPKPKPEHTRNWRCLPWQIAIIYSLAFIVVVIVVVVALQLSGFNCSASTGPACPPKWVGYEGCCFYFSREERNWSSSQSFCESQQASLAKIESEEKDFISLLSLKYTYWIGLKKGPDQHWEWSNGEKATLPVLGDGGRCAYLNDEAKASASRCGTEHHWICSKADALNPK